VGSGLVEDVVPEPSDYSFVVGALCLLFGVLERVVAQFRHRLAHGPRGMTACP
jgi:hypothetical protein